MSKARLLDRSKPYRTLFTNPRGARYEQGGELFNCGCIHIKDLGKVKDKEPTEPLIEGHEEILNQARAEAEKIIQAAKEKAESIAKAKDAAPVGHDVTVAGAKETTTLNSVPGKLSDEIAKEIRDRVTTGVSVATLAEEYNVSTNSINSVITGKTYKNAGGPIQGE